MKKILLLIGMLILFSSYVSSACDVEAELKPYLRLCYDLEEVASPYDDAKNNLDWTLGTDPDRVAGVNGFGQNFNASDFEWIETANSDQLYAEDWTWTFWYEPFHAGVHRWLIDYTSGSTGCYIALRDSNKIEVACDAGNTLTRTTDTYAPDVMYFVSVNYTNITGAYPNVYTNLSEAVGYDFSISSGLEFQANTHIETKNSPGGDRYLSGVVDEIMYFNTSISSDCQAWIFNNKASCDDILAADENFSIDIDYPINQTTYYGDYNGSVIISLLAVNGTVNCSLNDTRYSFDSYDNLTYNFINNTPINTINVSITANCSDSSHNDFMDFWFYRENILEIVLYDELTNTLLETNATIELISEGVGLNYTTTGSSFNVTSLIPGDYEILYNADGYHPRVYFLTILTGTLHNINLYLINDSVDISTRIVLTLYDQNADPAVNITMKLQRYYVSSNDFVTVTMRRTNFEGQAAFYVELYDVSYKVQYEDLEGNILKITSPSPFYVTNPTDKINTEEDTFLSWSIYDNVINNLSFVNQTGIIYARLVYSDTTNVVREVCLKVDRVSTKGLFPICNNCTSSTAGTLTCVIDTTLDGEYKAVALLDTDTEGSWYTIAVDFYKKHVDYDMGQDGILYGLLIVGTFALMAISTIVGSILLMVVAVIFVGILGLVQGFNLGIIFYLVMTAFVIIFMIRKVVEK